VKKTVLSAAALTIVVVTPAWSGQLTQGQIEALVVGRSLVGVNELGQTYRQCYKPDHTATGVSTNTAGSSHTETGTWSIRDGTLCTKWNQWRSGVELCNTINFENNVYTWGSGPSVGRTFQVLACP
jgi:hypothetical protein